MNAPRSVNDRRCIRSIGGVQEGGKGGMVSCANFIQRFMNFTYALSGHPRVGVNKSHIRP
jgi:dihydroxyacetone kinase